MATQHADWLPLALCVAWLTLAGLGLARSWRLWRQAGSVSGRGPRALAYWAWKVLWQVLLPLLGLLVGAEWLWRYQAPRTHPIGRPGEFVLVVVGGSTAEGRPRCASFGPAVARALGGAIKGQRVVPHVLAQGGHSVYPQSILLERTLRTWPMGVPGAVLLYAGHNDRIDPDAGALWYWPAELALSRVSWLVRDTLWVVRQRSWTTRTASLVSYHDLLDQMVAQTRAAGLVPVMTTVASNLIDLEPGVEVDSATLAGPDRSHRGGEAWWLFHRARQAYDAGQYEQALQLAWQAVDRDQRVMFGRATTAQNEVIRQVAARHGAVLVEGVAAVAAGAPHGIPGAESFIDGHHPSTPAYARLADGMAQGLAGRLGVRVVAAPDPDAIVPAGCEAHEVASALLGGASWLLATSVGSVPMPHRLALAERDVLQSLALYPTWSGWAGLALVHAARLAATNNALATAINPTDWMLRLHAVHREQFCLNPADVPALPGFLQVGMVPSVVQAGLTLQSLWGEHLCRPL